jgi:hypothetical protein
MRSTIFSYIEEILALQYVGFYLRDAAISIILWRSTSAIRCMGRDVTFPLHSMMAFILLAILVEKPQFLPSFTLFSIAWLLLATMEYRRGLPDVWSRCKSFMELTECLAYGESRVAPDTIAPFANAEAADAFLKQWQKRIADAEDMATAVYDDEAISRGEDTEALLSELDTIALSAPRRGTAISLDPFRPILFPVREFHGFHMIFAEHSAHSSILCGK